MKKLINDPKKVADDMLDGIAAAHPDYVKRLDGFDVLIRTGAKKEEKVTLVSGGGGGHEPAHGGYVGRGMLDAAVTGAMFTSPTPDQVYEAVKAVECGKGTLLIIKNYTGDVMNFEMARELAEMEGLSIDEVIVADDVAVENSTWTSGRRGIAGTVFVHKIAGAAAEKGASLEEVKRVAEKVCSNVRSMGMALEACTVPEAGQPGFDLKDDEMELGIGIHGEPGICRETIKSADEIAAAIFEKLMAEGIYRENDRVAVLVNGMGGTPVSELYIINRTVQKLLKDNKLVMAKTFVGNYMTALEMKGFSLSLLKLDEELEQLLNEPADTVSFKV